MKERASTERGARGSRQRWRAREIGAVRDVDGDKSPARKR